MRLTCSPSARVATSELQVLGLCKYKYYLQCPCHGLGQFRKETVRLHAGNISSLWLWLGHMPHQPRSQISLETQAAEAFQFRETTQYLDPPVDHVMTKSPCLISDTSRSPRHEDRGQLLALQELCLSATPPFQLAGLILVPGQV